MRRALMRLLCLGVLSLTPGRGAAQSPGPPGGEPSHDIRPNPRHEPASLLDESDEPGYAVKLVGVSLLPDAVVRGAMGPVSQRPTHEWGEAALKRIVGLYFKKGYRLVRGWVSRNDDGRVCITVDEGKISRITFTGAGSIRLLMLKVDIYLPDSVYHKPTLDDAMRRIIKKYGLSNAYYRVRDLPVAITPFGKEVSQRMLHVYIVGRQSFGWGLDIGLNSSWGLVPAVSLAQQGLVFKDDRASVKVGVGFPYRKFLYEEQAQFEWVHGFLEGTYRPTLLASEHIEPFVEFSTTASRYRRTDIDLVSFQLFHADVLLDVRLRPAPFFNATLGLGYDSVEVFNREMVEEDEDPPEAPAIKSFAARLKLRFESGRRALRQDLRTFLETDVRLALADSEQWVVRGGYTAQWVINFYAHNLILSSRGVMFAGTVHFWDQESLSSYLRVFFDDRYWIEEAMQVTAELRLALFGDTFQLGVFHQGALFTDLTNNRFHAELANAFGPSVHFMVFDNFAIDVYYGFGFSPAGFGHNYNLTVAKVF